MARLTQQHRAPSAKTPASLTPGGGQPADIVELIVADHRQIRRLCQAVDDAARQNRSSGPSWVLTAAWQRLAALLDIHTRAEEEICYLPMWGSGPQDIERMRAAIACHDDLREAISEASLQRAGSPPWWHAVQAVLAAIPEHLDREEHAIQSGWIPRLTMDSRRELGRQWSAFTAAWAQDATRAR